MNSLLSKRWLAVLVAFICLTSCTKVETDFEEEETGQSTIVTGNVVTTGKEPIPGVAVQVIYNESQWLAYANSRHKAQATTGKDGNYRLHFSIKDDEMESPEDKDAGIHKFYSLRFLVDKAEMDKYILPADFRSAGGSSPDETQEDDLQRMLAFDYYPFSPAETFTHDLYIPRKKYVRVTLKGFKPQATGDRFEVTVAFPYGGREMPDNVTYSDGYAKISNLFKLESEKEQTFTIPCALGETNILTLERVKDGRYTEEKQEIAVTENEPEELVYTY